MEKHEVLDRVYKFAQELMDEGASATDVVFAMGVYYTTGLVVVGDDYVLKASSGREDNGRA